MKNVRRRFLAYGAADAAIFRRLVARPAVS